MAIDVLSSIIGEAKEKKGTKSEPKRYIPYTIPEWRELIEKPLGREMTAQEAKEFFARLLKGLAEGKYSLEVESKG